MLPTVAVFVFDPVWGWNKREVFVAIDDPEFSAEEHLKLRELDMLWENSKRQRKQRVQFALIFAFASFVGLGLIAFKFFDQKKQMGNDTSVLISEILNSQERNWAAEFAKSKAVLLENFKESVEKASTENNIDAKTAVIISETSQLKSRLDLIESSISENPQRALSLPMLRRDQEELSRKLDEFRISTKADNDRLWGQMNTILQFLFAIFLALATGAVTVLYGAYKQRESGKS